MKRVRRSGIWLLVLAVLLLAAAAVPAQAAEAGISVDGKPVRTGDASPAMIGGVLQVPLRPIVAALGGQVTWDAAAGAATATAGRVTAVFTVGQASAQMGGRVQRLPAAPQIRGGHLLVPAGPLLSLFAPRLDITWPGLRDVEAMFWLQRSLEKMPANLDLLLDQTITVTLPGPQPQTVQMDMNYQFQVRGAELLGTVTLSAPQLGMAQTTMLTAVRGGRQFMGTAGQWTELPPGPTPAALQALTGSLGLAQGVKEAHMGQLRWVGGQAYHDVVFTMDVGSLKAFTDQMLSTVLPQGAGLTLDFTWENAEMTATFDGNGRQVSGTASLALTLRMTVGTEKVEMTMVMEQTQRYYPSLEPIAWPDGLPR